MPIDCPTNDFECAAAAAAKVCKGRAGCTGFALSAAMWNNVKLYAKNASAAHNPQWTYWVLAAE
jgi:hypothetical protein